MSPLGNPYGWPFWVPTTDITETNNVGGKISFFLYSKVIWNRKDWTDIFYSNCESKTIQPGKEGH